MMVSGQLQAPAALLPGKELRYPLNRRPGGLKNQSGRCEGERNIFFLLGIEPKVVARLASTSSLYRLAHPGRLLSLFCLTSN
jgi:hypothetical protein